MELTNLSEEELAELQQRIRDEREFRDAVRTHRRAVASHVERLKDIAARHGVQPCKPVVAEWGHLPGAIVEHAGQRYRNDSGWFLPPPCESMDGWALLATELEPSIPVEPEEPEDPEEPGDPENGDEVTEPDPEPEPEPEPEDEEDGEDIPLTPIEPPEGG